MLKIFHLPLYEILFSNIPKTVSHKAKKELRNEYTERFFTGPLEHWLNVLMCYSK